MSDIEIAAIPQIDTEWVAPDWCPDDAGDILFRDGDWILVRDYLCSTREPMSTPIHLCGGIPWVPHYNAAKMYKGRCDNCQEVAPDAFIGFFELVRWER